MPFISRDLRQLVIALVLVFAAGAGIATAQECEGFMGPTTFATGYDPIAIAIRAPTVGGADIAVAFGSRVGIVNQWQDGFFTEGKRYEIGSTATSVVLADLDGDYTADLVAGGSADVIGIRLTSGNWGYLPTEQVVYASDSPRALLALDVDGDSDIDLAVANGDANTVSILRNDGSGTFAPGVPYAVGMTPASLATGDFDGDGDRDLVAGNSGADTVSVLRNDGSGAFTVSTHTVGANAAGVAVGDVDGDSDADIVVTASSTDEVVVLISNGDGTFESPVAYPVGDNPGAVAASDLDGDGTIDLAVVNRDANTFTLLFGAGDGTFAGSTLYGTGRQPSAIVAADLNEDEVMDLAIPSGGGSDVRMFFGAGGGIFTSHHGSYAEDVITADWNRDGHQDFALAGGGIRVSLGRGDGAFEAPLVLDASVFFHRLTSGYFNDDAFLDIVGGSSGGIYLFPGAADGGFGPPVFVLFPSNLLSLVSGDFNGDGEADLAFVGSASFALVTMEGNGDGTFGLPVEYDLTSSPYSMIAADFNGDGRDDIAMAGDGLSVYLAASNGTLSAPVQHAIGWLYSLTTADFDGDGKLDLAVGHLSSPMIQIFPGAGDGSFVAGPSYSWDYDDAMALAAADLTGDGELDLAVGLTDPSPRFSAAVLTGRGDGTFHDFLNKHVFSEATLDIAVADFNEDGAIDLLLAEGDQASVAFNVSSCASPTAISPASGPPAGGQSVTISGTGLLGATSVTFDGTPATITANTATSITVTTPPHPAALVSIGVSTAGGKGLLQNAYLYEGVAPTAPTGLTAAAATSTRVDVSWNPVLGANWYIVERRAADTPYTPIGTPGSTSFADTTAQAGHAYLYRVRAANSFGASDPSRFDLATAVSFTDPALSGVRVKALHLSELRAAVDAVRLLAGITPAVYTDAAAAGVVIRAVHVTELRQFLYEARREIGITYEGYTDSSLDGVVLKAIHLQQIRDQMK